MSRSRSGQIVTIGFRHRYMIVACASCGRQIEQGEKAEINPSSNRSFCHTKYLCKECAAKPILVYQPKPKWGTKLAKM